MRRLALFARPPEPGRVKTRLAPALTPGLALELYRAMLADALEQGARVADERSVWWSGAPEPALDAGLRAWLETGGWRERIQAGSDLGVRLAAAFAELLAARADRAVISGADCPELDAAALDAAFAELDRSDAVLGPTADGGYYLIALRRQVPELFQDIAWSTGEVLSQTLDRAQRAGLSVTLLHKLDDIDRAEDVVHCARRELERGLRQAPPQQPSALPDAPRLGSHTHSALRAFGLLP